MATLRDILTPVFGEAAMADAEARVYAAYAGSQIIEHFTLYGCQDGLCAIGRMVRTNGGFRPYPHDTQPPTNPSMLYLVEAFDFLSTRDFQQRNPDLADALGFVMMANDTGKLATDGALTAWLDRDLAELRQTQAA